MLDSSVVPFNGDGSNIPGLVYNGVPAPQQIRAGTKLKLFSGTANAVCLSNSGCFVLMQVQPFNDRTTTVQALSSEVANHLGVSLGQIRIKRFADGEIYVQVQESIRGCDVFLIQPTCPTSTASVNDMLMELMVMVDACKYVFKIYREQDLVGV